MSKLKILYIASEITPFLNTSAVADCVRKLSQAMQEKGMEIRILVPRFGVINERKNNLHEVLRLSGMNITIGNKDKLLLVKVTSIPHTKLQVYFIDNEDAFQRKAIFFDQEHNFFADNDERAIFFCKGVLATIKKLEWEPDIIHCHDWITSLIPLYLKTAYQNDPIFKRSKVIFTLYNNTFSHKFDATLIEKAKMIGMNDGALVHLASADFAGLIKTAHNYADATVRAESLHDDNFKDILTNEKIPCIENDAQCAAAYYTLYQKLVTAS